MIRASSVEQGVETRAWFENISRYHNFNLLAEQTALAGCSGVGKWSKRDAGDLRADEEDLQTGCIYADNIIS